MKINFKGESSNKDSFLFFFVSRKCPNETVN
nr:MAG TPA: hypothetical protein [Caudoviricetes sp.]